MGGSPEEAEEDTLQDPEMRLLGWCTKLSSIALLPWRREEMRATEVPAVALQRLRRSSETRTVPEDDFETPAIAAKMKIFEKILLDDCLETELFGLLLPKFHLFLKLL